MVERTERLTQLLDDAILIAESSLEDTVLRRLHEARRSLLDSTAGEAAIRVDLLSGRVFGRGLPIALSRAELALVVALALHERGLPREVLAESLYAGDDESALNAVKVHVHRVRRRIGTRDVIRCVAGRYVLGDTVDVELPRLEAQLRLLRVEESLTGDQRDRLERIRQRVLDGRPAFMLDWSWFDETERRLREFGRELTATLGWDALRGEHYQRALDLAAELARGDPLDETAVEIAIRACMLAGNRTAAVLEYRRYKTVLRREEGELPSDDLRALVEDP